MNLVPLVRRAVLWHRGQLPEEEIPASYDLHLAGPLVSPSMKVHFTRTSASSLTKGHTLPSGQEIRGRSVTLA